MARRWLAVAGIGLALVAGCAEDTPQSYQECLLDLGRTVDRDAAIGLCREAFPEPEPEPPFYAGEFFYPNTEGTCGRIVFRSDGRVNTQALGYCGSGSRMECDADRCWFTCVNYNNSEETRVRLAEPVEDGIALYRSPGDSVQTSFLWKQMARCHLAIAYQPRLPVPDFLRDPTPRFDMIRQRRAALRSTTLKSSEDVTRELLRSVGIEAGQSTGPGDSSPPSGS